MPAGAPPIDAVRSVASACGRDREIDRRARRSRTALASATSRGSVDGSFVEVAHVGRTTEAQVAVARRAQPDGADVEREGVAGEGDRRGRRATSWRRSCPSSCTRRGPRGSTLRPWRTASLSNCVDNVVSCCQSIVPASPLDSTFTPRSDVVPSVLWTDVEPLTVVVVRSSRWSLPTRMLRRRPRQPWSRRRRKRRRTLRELSDMTHCVALSCKARRLTPQVVQTGHPAFGKGTVKRGARGPRVTKGTAFSGRPCSRRRRGWSARSRTAPASPARNTTTPPMSASGSPMRRNGLRRSTPRAARSSRPSQ